MLDKIKSLFKEEFQYSHMSGLLQQIDSIISLVHAQHMKDESGKNAAIDAICAILQSHKDAPKEK